MNKITLVVALFISLSAFAGKTVDRPMLNEKVKFQTEVFVTSVDGKTLRVIPGGWSESSVATGAPHSSSAIVNTESDGMKKLIAEIYVEVKDDMQIQIRMHQWEKMSYTSSHEPKFSNSTREETLPVVNFGSVQFVVPDSATQQYVVRVTPVISRKPVAEQLDYLPMSVTDVLAIDSQGRIWAQNTSADGEVVRITGRYGSIYLSFAPFSGSSPMGSALDNDIELKSSDKLTVHIRSSKAIIGAGYSAVVHARIEFGQKLPGSGITSTSKANVGRLLKDQ